MNKKSFVAALAILTFVSLNALNANAQSCPINESFGVHATASVDKGLQSKIEVTYFTTDDPNVFISEKGGFNRSASYMSLNSKQFVARIEKLESDGLASIQKRQSSTSYLGEVAQMNLGRNSLNANHAVRNANLSSNDLSALERKTEVSVYEGRASDGDYYRLSLLSWLVDAKAGGAQNVDYDAIVLVKPGQTALFKVKSNSGANGARSYIAVTMRSVDNVAQAAR